MLSLSLPGFTQCLFFVSLLTFAGCKKEEPTAWGTPGSAGQSAALNSRTEEGWAIREVCDTIVFLLHPDLVGKSIGNPRISATIQAGEPTAFQVEEGPAKALVSLQSSVWDPRTYQDWCRSSSGENARASTVDRDMLKELLTPDTAHFLVLEEAISTQMREFPRDPALHVDAALLLGTMAWMDAAGRFQDVRPFLNRMTAYLAVADFFGAAGPEREAAEILRLVLLQEQVEVVRKVGLARALPGRIPEDWLRAFEVTATGDWKSNEAAARGGSRLLQSAHLRVLTDAMGANTAEIFLKKADLAPSVEWSRLFNQVDCSVGQGHTHAGPILEREMTDARQIDRAYGLGGLGGLLSRLPSSQTRIFSKFDGLSAYERAPEPRVIGLQLWADRAQRHFLQGAATQWDFLANTLGIPEDAEQLGDAMRKEYGGCFYYPFAAIFLTKNPAPALAAADQLTRDRPERVSPVLWAALKPETPEGIARQAPDFHLFFHPELPHDTVFEAGKRIHEIGVGDENSLPDLKKIQQRCPWDYEIAQQVAIVEGRNTDPTEAKVAVYERFADRKMQALRWLAKLSENNPAQYESAVLQRAEYDPKAYLDLAWYFSTRNDFPRAEKYLLSARGQVDDVAFANYCAFAVEEYARTGRIKEAGELAAAAADTYSSEGLRVLAWLHESQKNWDEAWRIYSAIDTRYGVERGSEKLSYLLRRKLAGEGWQVDFEPILRGVFPGGLRKVSTADANEAPRWGIRFTTSSEALRKTGIRKTDVVVAVDGFAVENQAQYTALRDASRNPDFVITTWNGKKFSEVAAHQPGRRFNVQMEDFRR